MTKRQCIAGIYVFLTILILAFIGALGNVLSSLGVI